MIKKPFTTKEKLEEIAAKYPTPFHIYDEAGIRKNAEALKQAFSWNKGFKEYFAVKACPNPFLVKMIAEEGCGVDCSSYTELMLSDLEILEKRRDKAHKLARSNDADAKLEYELICDLIGQLSEGRRPIYDESNPKAVELVKSFGLLSMMPAFVCANTDENTFRNFTSDPRAQRLTEFASAHRMEIVPVCAKLEEELGQLDPEDAAMFMEELGMSETGLNRVIKTGYRLLDYITFFTAGPMESRAWTVTRGTPAPQAAGKIHTDLCRGFIRMETVSYEDLVAAGGWAKAQAAGKLRIEGKDYLIADGDVIHVRFSV